MTKTRATFYIIGILAAVCFIFLVSKTAAHPKTEYTQEASAKTPSRSEDDAVFGNPNAKTVVTLFGYVGCENCESMRASLLAITETSADVAIVWKDYPNTSIAPYALSAALAARCAQEQDAFFDYQSRLIEAADELGTSAYVSIAEEMELNVRKFESCLSEQKTADVVQNNIHEGNNLKVTAVPTIFVGEDRYTGAFTERELLELLHVEL